MRGSYLHNRILIEMLYLRFLEAGADAQREVPVRVGSALGFVDLLVEFGDFRIVVEAECSARRISADLAKAMAVDSDELWIVVPNLKVRNSVLRRLVQMCVRVNRGGLFVLTLGQALQRVSNCLPLFARSNAWRQSANKRQEWTDSVGQRQKKKGNHRHAAEMAQSLRIRPGAFRRRLGGAFPSRGEHHRREHLCYRAGSHAGRKDAGACGPGIDPRGACRCGSDRLPQQRKG